MSTVDRHPYSANNFEVDLGAGVIGFAEVSGLGYEIDYTGGANGEPTREPKHVAARVTEVSLKRGITGDRAVWTWVRAAADRRYEPRTVIIRLLDEQRVPACSWTLRNARPIRWRGPSLSATLTGVALEEIVLIADEIDFESAAGDGSLSLP